jgi:hypothetical protein
MQQVEAQVALGLGPPPPKLMQCEEKGYSTGFLQIQPLVPDISHFY